MSIGIGVIVCLFGFFSAICLPHCGRRRNATFYGTWPARAMLSALGALLLARLLFHSLCALPHLPHTQAAQLLRMTHIWAQTTLAVQETTSGLGLLCRLYLCIAWGLLQPWFLCLALLLCRRAIQYVCAAACTLLFHSAYWYVYCTVPSPTNGVGRAACRAQHALPPAPRPSAPSLRTSNLRAHRATSLQPSAAAMVPTTYRNPLHLCTLLMRPTVSYSIT